MLLIDTLTLKTSFLEGGIPEAQGEMSMNQDDVPCLPVTRGHTLLVALVLLLVGLSASSLNAMEPLYVGLSVGTERLAVDYTKSVGLAAAPGTKNTASMLASRDSAHDTSGVFRMVAGYRVLLAKSVYLAGELEAALYGSAKVAGYLPGTGSGDRDVWRGAWSLTRHFGIGGSVNLGYVPEALGFLGPGRSVYLSAGVRWVDTEIDTAHDRCGASADCTNPVTGTFRDRFTAAAWRAGIGTQLGSRRHRFDVHVSREANEKTLRRRQGGMTFATPNLGYDFGAEAWSVTFGYVFAFSL